MVYIQEIQGGYISLMGYLGVSEAMSGVSGENRRGNEDSHVLCSATCPYRSSRFVRSGQDVISPRLNESASLDKFQHHDQDISRHITYGLTCLSGRPRNTIPLPCGNTREPTQESIGYVAIDPIVGVETCLLRRENSSGLHQDRLLQNNTHLVGICLAFGWRSRVLVLAWILEWILCGHCPSVKSFEGREPLPA